MSTSARSTTPGLERKINEAERRLTEADSVLLWEEEYLKYPSDLEPFKFRLDEESNRLQRPSYSRPRCRTKGQGNPMGSGKCTVEAGIDQKKDSSKPSALVLSRLAKN